MKYRRRPISGKWEQSACRVATGKAKPPNRRRSATCHRCNGSQQLQSRLVTGRPLSWKQSIVQNYIEQRAVDLQRAFRATCIVNEAQLSETVHEEADSNEWFQPSRPAFPD